MTSSFDKKDNRRVDGLYARPPIPDLSWYADASNSRKRKRHVKELCAAIARGFRPSKIILFGSQASGTPNDQSDIDLLVVMPYEGSPLRQAAEILKQLNVWMPVDLIVRNKEDIEKRLMIGDRFIKNILEHGRVMYKAVDR